METIKEGLEAVQDTDSGILFLKDHRGHPAGAIVTLSTMERMAEESLRALKAQPRKRPTRKERKLKSRERREREDQLRFAVPAELTRRWGPIS